MEFLKANIVSLYVTGEADRLLDPLSRLLAFSAADVETCRAGLATQKAAAVPLAGAAAAVDSATDYLGALFGMNSSSSR